MTLTLKDAPSEVRRYITNGLEIPAADRHGHRTRYSDSSLYDERCLLCGETDRETPGPLGQPCSHPMSDAELEALRNPTKIEADWDPQA